MIAEGDAILEAKLIFQRYQRFFARYSIITDKIPTTEKDLLAHETMWKKALPSLDKAFRKRARVLLQDVWHLSNVIAIAKEKRTPISFYWLGLAVANLINFQDRMIGQKVSSPGRESAKERARMEASRRSAIKEEVLSLVASGRGWVAARTEVGRTHKLTARTIAEYSPSGLKNGRPPKAKRDK